jgi:ABC-2 type transport system ATP-binding protein
MRIELSQVRKRYGQVVALAGVTLEVPSGARVALIGPNGSGKTTLTRAILGVVAHEGEIRLGGEPAARARARLASQIAYVPQVAPQLASSADELCASVARLRGLDPGDVHAMMQALALDPVALRGRPFRGLSGGMKQKLLLALALAARASLLVLDEPTASLDAQARARFYALHEERTAGATVLLSSHRLEEIRHMVDHVIALDDGHVVYHGAAAAYLEAHTVAVLELELDPTRPRAAAWARAHGFHPVASGWWMQTIPAAQKLALLGQAMAELGGSLRNVCVRDHETVVAPRGVEVARAA